MLPGQLFGVHYLGNHGGHKWTWIGELVQAAGLAIPVRDYCLCAPQQWPKPQPTGKPQTSDIDRELEVVLCDLEVVQDMVVYDAGMRFRSTVETLIDIARQNLALARQLMRGSS